MANSTILELKGLKESSAKRGQSLEIQKQGRKQRKSNKLIIIWRKGLGLYIHRHLKNKTENKSKKAETS